MPKPPRISGSLKTLDADMRALDVYFRETHKILNGGLQSIQNRLNTVQQTGAIAPPMVTGLTVSGLQGLFYLTWKRMANVDGYVIMQASDSAMLVITGRYNVPDGEQCSFRIPVGNAAITAYFQIYAYQGPQYSAPAAIISGTSLEYATPESAPSAPPIAPRHPKVAPVRSGPNL